MSDLTIFVSTFNRIDTLTNCLNSLKRQSRPKRIVIVDNGSRDPTAIALLKRLEKKHTVYWLPAIEDVPEDPTDVSHHGGHGMQAVQRNVSEAFRLEWERKPTRWYGMTDADLTLDSRAVMMVHDTNQLTGPAVRAFHRRHPEYRREDCTFDSGLAALWPLS